MQYLFSDEYGVPTYKSLAKDPNKSFFLSVVVVEPTDYSLVRNKIEQFKNKWFGSQKTYLRFCDISRRENHCSFLSDRKAEVRFHKELYNTYAALEFSTMGVYISREKMKNTYIRPAHPYLSAMQIICERLLYYEERKFKWCFEARGNKEDNVYIEGLKRLQNEGYIDQNLPQYHKDELRTLRIEARFRTKKDCIPGLDLADSVAFCLGSSFRKRELKKKELWPFSSDLAKLFWHRRLNDRAIAKLPL
jgi:hypothetical protein